MHINVVKTKTMVLEKNRRERC